MFAVTKFCFLPWHAELQVDANNLVAIKDSKLGINNATTQNSSDNITIRSTKQHSSFFFKESLLPYCTLPDKHLPTKTSY